MSVLDDIVIHKRAEVEANKAAVPARRLETTAHFKRATVSLKRALTNSDTGIIAEFKRRSPSKGIIHDGASAANVSTAYEAAGVSGISILTDVNFFGGSNKDLTDARDLVACPILRKDFIIDEYQIIEAKSIGADVILLIAAVLAPAHVKAFCTLAHGLGLEVLLEIHDEREWLENADTPADIVGVNNRDLKTFKVSVETSRKLSKVLGTRVKISESGIESPETIVTLKEFGYNGFLIGQTFMEQRDPGRAAEEFMGSLEKSINPR